MQLEHNFYFEGVRHIYYFQSSSTCHFFASKVKLAVSSLVSPLGWLSCNFQLGPIKKVSASTKHHQQQSTDGLDNFLFFRKPSFFQVFRHLLQSRTVCVKYTNYDLQHVQQTHITKHCLAGKKMPFTPQEFIRGLFTKARKKSLFKINLDFLQHITLARP